MSWSDLLEVFEHCFFDRDADREFVWVPMDSVCMGCAPWDVLHPYGFQWRGKVIGPWEERPVRGMTFEFPCDGCDLIFRTRQEFDRHVMWRFGGEEELIGFGLLLEQFLKRGISTDEAYRVADIVEASLSEVAFDEVNQMFPLEMGIAHFTVLEKAGSRQVRFQRYRSDWFRAFVLRVRSLQFPDAQISLSDSECVDLLLDSFLNVGGVPRQKIMKHLFDVGNVRLQDCVSSGKKLSETTRKAIEKIRRLKLRGLKAAECFDECRGDHFGSETAMQRHRKGLWPSDLDNLKEQVSPRPRRKYKTLRHL